MATARPEAPEAPRKITAADFLAFPDDFPPHSQLVEGTVVVNEPKLRHQRVCLYLQHLMTSWTLAQSGQGEVFLPIDVPINEYNVFAPDVSWYAEEHRPPREAELVDRLPDLAIEVRSPSTWCYDVGPKFLRYQAAGLPELWLVDTASKTVLVYRRSTPEREEFDAVLELGAGATLTTPLLPGLVVEIDELFNR